MSPRAKARVFALLLLSTLAICLVAARPASPADKPKPWVTKDWTRWTADDCLYVLNGSPWVLQTIENLPSSGPLSDYRMSLVQLRSALPIRQALLRQIQLEKHYDGMSDREKQEFDTKYTAELPGIESGNVVVVIRNGSVEPPQPLKRNDPHSDVTVGPQIARQAALLANGNFVNPVQTIETNYHFTQINEFTNQFEYIFPRAAVGRPLFSSGDSSLIISLGAPLAVDKKTGKVQAQAFQSSGPNFIFSISDLMYKGKLEY
jgi:hypothetical protein